MKKSTPFVALVPLVIVAALAGCTPPGGSPSATPTAAGLAACVEGHTWNLDVDDVAQQLLQHFQSAGLPITSAAGSGTQTMKWDVGGSTDIETNHLTYELVITQNPTTTLSVQQVQDGPATGTFVIDGSTATPSDWDASDYHVETNASVNGVGSGSAPITLPDQELTGVTFALTCSGTTLTTAANDGFITYKWTR